MAQPAVVLSALADVALHPVMASLLVTTTAASLYFWITQPGLVIKYFFSASMYMLGFQLKYVQVGDEHLCYAERGKKKKGVPTLLMLHGFSADKTMYLPMIPFLDRSQHLILLDFPGHGDSSIPDEAEELSFTWITETIKQFNDEVKLSEEPIHIIGTSLGGAIAAVYSGKYPHLVAKTTLICPAMLTPVITDFQKDVREGKCLLLANTAEGIGTIMDKCLYNKKIGQKNKQVLNGIAQQRAPNTHFHEKLFRVISTDMDQYYEDFLDKVRNITADVQVMWGVHDELIHVSGAKVLQENLQYCVFVDVLDHCGHVISMDRPRKMAQDLQKFIEWKDDNRKKNQ